MLAIQGILGEHVKGVSKKHHFLFNFPSFQAARGWRSWAPGTGDGKRGGEEAQGLSARCGPVKEKY